MTARRRLDNELEILHFDLIKMGSMAEEAIDTSIKALQNRDKELAKAVFENDDRIDQMEKEIETRCLSIILRQQPVAGDLRKVSTALKMITDIERIADNAADIAEISLNVKGEQTYTLVRHIPKMTEIAVYMVHSSITSFVNEDLELAEKIIKMDDEVDLLFCKVKDDIAEILKEDMDTYHNSIDFLMIAKYLERIADHAVNICEWVEFMHTGKHKNIQII